MRKSFFCICENKDADQLRSNCAADQRLCFRYTDSTIPLLPRSEISSLWSSSVVVQPGLCQTWSEAPKTGSLTTRFNYEFPNKRKEPIGFDYHITPRPIPRYPVTRQTQFWFWFGLMLNVPVNNFSVMFGRSNRFLCITCTFGG